MYVMYVYVNLKKYEKKFKFSKFTSSNLISTFQQDLNFGNRVRSVWVILKFVKKKKKKNLSNKTSLKGSRNMKKKTVFLSSSQLTEQRGLCSYSGVFSLSHPVINKEFPFYFRLSGNRFFFDTKFSVSVCVQQQHYFKCIFRLNATSILNFAEICKKKKKKKKKIQSKLIAAT